MNIGFDLKNLWLYGKGIGSFTTAILRDINNYSTNKADNLQLFSPSFDIEDLSFLKQSNNFSTIETLPPSKESKYEKVLYDQITLLRALKNAKSDILYSPYFDVPLFWNKPLITTIHDLSIFELGNIYGRGYFIYNKMLLKNALKKSSFIITVSEYSKKKIIDVFGYAEDKIFVFYNKLPNTFTNFRINYNNELEKKIKEKYLLPNEFILYTGGLEKRKNIPLLFKAFKKARKLGKAPLLVITGAKTIAEETPEFAYLLNQNDILLLDLLPKEYMPYLYNLCTLVINTSYYEGFGIPILEAITMNKPILCSDIPVFKEIGKDAVLYFKNNNAEDLTLKIIDFFLCQGKHIETDTLNKVSSLFNNQSYASIFFDLIHQSTQQ